MDADLLPPDSTKDAPRRSIQRLVQPGVGVDTMLALMDKHALPHPYWYSPRVMLYRGDCEEIMPMLKKAVDAIITDPPYGMAWNAKGKMGRPSSVATAGGTYGRDWGYIEGDRKPFDPAPMIAMGKPLVTWGANHYANRLPLAPGWLIWDKKRGGTAGKGYTGSDCEMAWCSETGDSTAIYCLYWDGFRRDSEVGEHYHPTQKPVSLMAWCMEQAKVPSPCVVLDPYMGSGSTGIAAIRTGRSFIGIEKDPTHFKTALERIQKELAQGDLFHGLNA